MSHLRYAPAAEGHLPVQVLSLTLCGIVLIYLLVHKEPVRAVLGFVVVLLVASIPIAIEIVRSALASARPSPL
jgi:hypothetical protein